MRVVYPLCSFIVQYILLWLSPEPNKNKKRAPPIKDWGTTIKDWGTTIPNKNKKRAPPIKDWGTTIPNKNKKRVKLNEAVQQIKKGKELGLETPLNKVSLVSNSEQNSQNAQRLGGDASSQIVLPRMLGDLIVHDNNVLNRRQAFIANSNTENDQGRPNPNSKEMNAYKQSLPMLSQVQTDWCVGMLLGDASIQTNNNLGAHRLKMQQAEKNREFIDVSVAVLQPWCLSAISEVKQRSAGNCYREMQTISHEAFNTVAAIFSDPLSEKKKNAVVRKVVKDGIKEYLSPVGVAAWYCGDGGRRDYGQNEGKAIHLHTQGFDLVSVENRAQALRERYAWEAHAKFDYTSPSGNDCYFVQIEASSFESFVKEIYSFLPSFAQKRLPSPRKPGSRFGIGGLLKNEVDDIV